MGKSEKEEFKRQKITLFAYCASKNLIRWKAEYR